MTPQPERAHVQVFYAILDCAGLVFMCGCFLAAYCFLRAADVLQLIDRAVEWVR